MEAGFLSQHARTTTNPNIGTSALIVMKSHEESNSSGPQCTLGDEESIVKAMRRTTWPDHRIQNLFGIELPIIQAPMAGAAFSDMVVGVAEAGGLGSLACAQLTANQIIEEVRAIRRQTSQPFNLNFFCHQPPKADAEREAAWRRILEPYFIELGLDPALVSPVSGRAAFDSAMCDLVTELKPNVVSFHFGLPEKSLMACVKETGAKILSTATTVQEAQWLEAQGCDAIIAQGYEAGGHRGMFLTGDVSTQIGTFSLVPQVVDKVKVPVIAAGGIADARGISAAFALGAAAVQIGTAYMLSPESRISALHRQALKSEGNETVLTNVFTGRPARGIVNRMIRETGPMSKHVPDFPLAGRFSAPLRAKSEAHGKTDFTPMWSGQSARLARELPAKEITQRLASEALARLDSR
jgi:nitronate monooxygenase